MTKTDDSEDNIQTANIAFHAKPCRVFLRRMNFNNRLNKDIVRFPLKPSRVYLSPININNQYTIFRNCEVSLTRLAPRVMLAPVKYVTKSGRIATRFIHPNTKKSTAKEQLKKKSNGNKSAKNVNSLESRGGVRGINQTSINEDKKASANQSTNNDVNGNFTTRGTLQSKDGGLRNKVNVGSNVEEAHGVKNQKKQGKRVGNKSNLEKINRSEETSRKGNLKKSVGNKGDLKKCNQREIACVEGEEIACVEGEEIACVEVEEIACIEDEDQIEVDVEDALKRKGQAKQIKDKCTVEDGKLRRSAKGITKKILGTAEINESVLGRRNAKDVEERAKNKEGMERNIPGRTRNEKGVEEQVKNNKGIEENAKNNKAIEVNAKVLGRRRNGKDVEERVKNNEGIEENVSRRRRNGKDVEEQVKNKGGMKGNVLGRRNERGVEERVKNNEGIEETARNNEAIEVNARVLGGRRNWKDVEEHVKNNEGIEENVSGRRRNEKDVEEPVKNNDGNAKSKAAIEVHAKNIGDSKKIVENVDTNLQVLLRRRKDVERQVKNKERLGGNVPGRRNEKGVEERVKNIEGIEENAKNNEAFEVNARALGRRRNGKDVDEGVKNNEGFEDNVSRRRRNEKDVEGRAKNNKGNVKNNKGIEENARVVGRRRNGKDVEEGVKNNEGIEENVSGRRNEEDVEERVKNNEGNAKNDKAIEVTAKNNEDLKKIVETVKTNPRVLGKRRNEEDVSKRVKYNARNMKKNEGVQESATNNKGFEENAKNDEEIESTAEKNIETASSNRRQKPKVNYRISEVLSKSSKVSASGPIYKKEVAMIRDHKQNDVYEFDFHEEKRQLKQLDDDSDYEKGFDKAINEEMKHIKKMEEVEKRRVRRNDKRISEKILKDLKTKQKLLKRNRHPSPKKPWKLKTQTSEVQQVEDQTQKIKDLMIKVKEQQRHNEEKRLTRSLEMSENGLEMGLNGSKKQAEMGVVEDIGSKEQLEMGVLAENVLKKRLEDRKKLEMEVVEEEGLKRFELEDDELAIGPVEDVDEYEEVVEPAATLSPGIEENFGFGLINILQEIRIAPKSKKTFSRPNANSTMIASPWRTNLISKSGPRYLTTKRSSNLPTYDQDLVINSTIVEGSFMGSPCKPKTLKQSSILDFVEHRSPRSRPQNYSLFDADLLSPIKKAPEIRNILGTKSVLNFNQDILTRRREFLNPKRNPTPNRNPLSPRNHAFSPKSRNIINLPSPRKASLSPNRPSTSPKRPSRSPKRPDCSTSNKENCDENFMTPARSEEDVFFGFDNSFNPDPQTRVGVPTRVSMREVKRVVDEEKRAVQLLEAEAHNVTEVPADAEPSEVFMSPVSQLDENEPIVGLFEDFVVKAPAKSTYERKARKRYPDYSISGEDSDEEIAKKSKRKKKKNGFTKQEQIEANKWIEKFNSMCEEVEQYSLEIE